MEHEVYLEKLKEQRDDVVRQIEELQEYVKSLDFVIEAVEQYIEQKKA